MQITKHIGLFTFRIVLAFLVLSTSCSSTEENSKPSTTEKLKLISSNPKDESNDIDFSTEYITLSFSENIKMNQPQEITINTEQIKRTTINLSELKLQVELSPNKHYTIIIPEGQLTGRYTDTKSQQIEINFKTKDLKESVLVTKAPSVQAQKLYEYLKSINGNKIITGTMANVSWNINEAEWVKYHTGEYPALNCFDYIHLYASPTSWINYENTQVVEDWWNNKGLVAAMWHWNVPKTEGSNTYAFYTKDTYFDAEQAVIKGTDEYNIIINDLNKIADNLLLLKEKNIPVLWRPLHEASGKWFWWGAKGAAPTVKLWHIMFNLFKERGLDNLIWIWTSEGDDDEWYPGNEYVDIIGVDMYDKKISYITSLYEKLKEKYPHKMLTLSEYGSIPNISEQWSNGAKWLWAMPWYDYERTLSTDSETFKDKSHQHANVQYWNNFLQMGEDIVILRRDVPDLK